jgi:hypothetical protein
LQKKKKHEIVVKGPFFLLSGDYMKFFLAVLCISTLFVSPIHAAVKAYDNNNTQLVAQQTGNRIDITLPVNHQSRALTAKIIALAGTGLTYLLGTIYEKSAHHAANNHAMSISQQGQIIKIGSQIIAVLLGVSLLKQALNGSQPSKTVTVELV